MKVDLIRKFKWYIVGFILIAVMLSVSLSFSAWDTLSFKAVMNANGGDFTEKPPWRDYIKGVGGVTLSSVPKVGDIVEYGKFYQTANAITTEVTVPLRWIVVGYSETTQVATLLTEKIVVYGNYWGSGQNLNDYYKSTVRSWLNSGKGSLMDSGIGWDDTKRYDDNVRSDGLPVFGKGSNGLQVNKGFLDVAFTGGAETLLVPKKITGMKYIESGTNGSNRVIVDCKTNGGDNENKSINDLVWLLSWQELYGADTPLGPPIDNASSASKFPYFTSDTQRIGGATDYAWNAGSSSYYNNGGGGPNDAQSAVWWWLRSPCPTNYSSALVLDTTNPLYGEYYTAYAGGGVRPAVNVQL